MCNCKIVTMAIMTKLEIFDILVWTRDQKPVYQLEWPYENVNCSFVGQGYVCCG